MPSWETIALILKIGHKDPEDNNGSQAQVWRQTEEIQQAGGQA